MMVKKRGKLSDSESLNFIDDKTIVNRSLVVVGVLAVLSFLIGLFSSLGYLESFRIVFGSLFVLFLPGFILSYVFFPFSKPFDEKEKDEDKNEREGNDGKLENGKAVGNSDNDSGNAIDWIERFALSFALSIAVVPLVVFYLNLAGVRISLLNVFLEILAVLIISVLILRYRLKKLDVK